MAYHQELNIQNFTAFRDARFTFTPGINAFVGANGTGKTHVLKLLFAIQYAQNRYREESEAQSSSFLRVYQAGKFEDLVRHKAKRSEFGGRWNGKNWYFSLKRSEEDDRTHLSKPETALAMTRPVFIPSTEMMGHTRRFLSTYDEYQIDFDLTHRDIVALLLSPERRENIALRSPENSAGYDALQAILGGEVVEESERFYLKTPNGRQPMPLVAEGLRKIATLQQLMKNGHLQPGSVLFWDEPEVHLSPLLMDEVVGALLGLARSGVQIFLATHSYVILKELDLQAESTDEVRFFGFQPTENGTEVHSTTDYAQLNPNPIAEQFDSIYDRELTRATRRSRK
jgi:predicted ATPase